MMLTLIRKTEGRKALYKCGCGNTKEAYPANVKAGRVISCGCVNRRTKEKMPNLLNGSLESYYWLGFLLADAHFTKLGKISMNLCEKDVEHLIKFNEFLGNPTTIKIRGGKCVFSVNDKKTVTTLMSKYGIEENKTYIPPRMVPLHNDHKTALLIGFIDGDGSIQRQYGRIDCRITIKLHGSWLEWLEYIMEKPCRLDSRGYAIGYFAKNSKVKELKKFAVENKLPVLSRKWEKIDMSYTNRAEISDANKVDILRLFDAGYNATKIATMLDMKFNTVYGILARNGKYMQSDIRE